MLTRLSAMFGGNTRCSNPGSKKEEDNNKGAELKAIHVFSFGCWFEIWEIKAVMAERQGHAHGIGWR
ncbi:hypothetical protein V6N13_131705 [Hibiscus sabdariffa]